MTALEKAISVSCDIGNRCDALLVRLASEPRKLVAERAQLPKAAADRLLAILVEIDEIVLPRMVFIKSGTLDVARLTVSQRRLIAVDLPRRPAVPGDTDQLPFHLAARLVEVAETRGDLRLTIARRKSHPNHAEAAVSVPVLADAIELARTQSGFDRLLERVTAHGLAQLLWTDTSSQMRFSGFRDWATPLQTVALGYRAMAQKHPADGRVGPVRTEGVAIPIGADHLIILASLEKRGFAALLPRKAGLEMIAAWQFH